LYQFETEFLGTLRQGTDLLFTISALVVLHAFVNVRLAVADEAIKQARQLSRHRGDGLLQRRVEYADGGIARPDSFGCAADPKRRVGRPQWLD
jgi:hypothetical protein